MSTNEYPICYSELPKEQTTSTQLKNFGAKNAARKSVRAGEIVYAKVDFARSMIYTCKMYIPDNTSNAEGISDITVPNVAPQYAGQDVKYVVSFAPCDGGSLDIKS